MSGCMLNICLAVYETAYLPTQVVLWFACQTEAYSCCLTRWHFVWSVSGILATLTADLKFPYHIVYFDHGLSLLSTSPRSSSPASLPNFSFYLSLSKLKQKSTTNQPTNQSNIHTNNQEIKTKKKKKSKTKQRYKTTKKKHRVIFLLANCSWHGVWLIYSGPKGHSHEMASYF